MEGHSDEFGANQSPLSCRVSIDAVQRCSGETGKSKGLAVSGKPLKEFEWWA